jgi:hypothetical protein
MLYYELIRVVFDKAHTNSFNKMKLAKRKFLFLTL